jgi:hypothetical protein
VIFEDGISIATVAEVDGNVRQRRPDQGVNVRVRHERHGIGLGAKYQSVEAVIEGNGL